MTSSGSSPVSGCSSLSAVSSSSASSVGDFLGGCFSGFRVGAGFGAVAYQNT